MKNQRKKDQVTWYSPKGEKIKVSAAWRNLMESQGTRGVGIAAYACDGVHFWPCGEAFDENEDEDEENVRFCQCKTCEKVRDSVDDIEELTEFCMEIRWH